MTIAFSTASYYTTTAYDPNTGRVTNARNFSSFETTNLYTNLGYLLKVVDYTSGFVYWQATARDAELHLLQDTQGAAMYETRAFDPDSGRVQSICAALETTTCSGDVAKFSYTWDTASNLAQRQGAFNSSTQAYTQTEDFCYDQLNRLTNSALAVSGASLSSCTSSGTNIIDNSVSYDEIGDILTKSDVGTYTYPSAGSAQPHGVASINTTTGCTLSSCTVAGASNPIYEYDANGNVICASVGAACAGTKIRTFTYSAANMTEKAKEETAYTYSFTYNPEHERSEMSDQSGDQTYYLNDPASNVMNERYSSGGVVTWRSYIVADGKIVELHSTSGSTTTMSYFVLDHLGSVATIYNPTGTPTITAQSYDAWGKMRNPTTGAGDPSCALPPASPTTRGFTNQEQMTQQCLDNYNARIYDPQIGRFMAADTVIPDTFNGQSYNRYTYVENGPLSYDDPTGHNQGLINPSALLNGGDVGEWPMSGGGFEGGLDPQVFANATQEGPNSAQGQSGSGLTVTIQANIPGLGNVTITFIPAEQMVPESDADPGPLTFTPEDQAARDISTDNGASGAPLASNSQTSSTPISASDGSTNHDPNQAEVTAVTNPWGIVDITQYPDHPAGPVLGTPMDDAWAKNLAAQTYISSSLPGSEVVDGLQKNGSTVQGLSEGNSKADIPAGSVAVFHDHPLQDLGGSASQHLGMNHQPWRLGFGPGDEAALVKYGAPNYMMNYERDLQVLEYTPEHGYATRDLGIIQYAGDRH